MCAPGERSVRVDSPISHGEGGGTVSATLWFYPVSDRRTMGDPVGDLNYYSTYNVIVTVTPAF